MIGKMPAATMLDQHVCPMCTGPVPHVGGPITLGSMGVFFGEKPAARISDVTVCAGPPSMPIVGCFTVLVGEVGAGSAGASAGAAASAQAAAGKGPKAIEAFPIMDPPPALPVTHEVRFTFQDSAGLPLAGVPYVLKDPKQAKIKGVSPDGGEILCSGYADAGSFEVEVQLIEDFKWQKTSAKMKDSVSFSAKTKGFTPQASATVFIYCESGLSPVLIDQQLIKLEGESVKGEWSWKPTYAQRMGEAVGSDFRLMLVIEGQVAWSNCLALADNVQIEVKDAKGRALKEVEAEIELPGGELRSGKTDNSGKFKVENVPAGRHPIRLKGTKKKE